MSRANIVAVLRFCAVVLLCSQHALAQQKPELIVEADKTSLYLGESITYDVTVNHVDNPSAPSFDAFKDFKVEPAGQQSLNTQQISIINGVRSEVIRRGMLFRFRLTPLKANEQAIPAPTAVVNGEELTGREVPINVIAPQQQDVVMLEVTADRESVYPMQPFTMTLTVAVRQLPGQLSDVSPLSVQGRNPVRLSVAWLDDDHVPPGLAVQKSWRDILQPLVSQSQKSGGMQINDIGTQSAFFLMGNRATTFLPPSERTTRSDLQGESAGYVEYKLSRTFVPEQVAEFPFSAATIKGTFATELSERLEGEEIYAISNSLTVTAKSPPLAGRPNSYIGGIGSFHVTAEVSPREASVGQPMTLTVAVQGTGTIADLQAPKLDQNPDMAALFRTYEPTAQTTKNGRIFTYSLRPLSQDVSQLPPIPVAFFDVDTEQYVEAKTAAVPLVISAAQQLATSDIIAAENSATGGINGLEVNDAGLFANHSSLQNLRAETFTTTRWLGIWCTMIVGYLALSFGVRRHQHIHSDPAILRRRNARSRATDGLRTVAAAAGSDAKFSPEALNRIVAGLISDFTGCPEAGMTSQDAKQHLQGVGVTDALRDRTAAFMSQCDAARFGAGAADTTALAEKCRLLINELSAELNSRC